MSAMAIHAEPEVANQPSTTGVWQLTGLYTAPSVSAAKTHRVTLSGGRHR